MALGHSGFEGSAISFFLLVYETINVRLKTLSFVTFCRSGSQMQHTTFETEACLKRLFFFRPMSMQQELKTKRQQNTHSIRRSDSFLHWLEKAHPTNVYIALKK